MAGDEDTRSNAPDASSSQANDNTPEHGRQVSNIIDGEQEGSNAAVDPNSRPAMSTATTQPPTLASPFAPTDNNLAGHSRVTSPAPPTTNSRGAEFAGGDMGAQQRATNLGEVVEQSANREIAVVNADQSDSDEVNQTNDRLDDVPDSDQFESRETSESEDQSTEPSAPAARRFISPSDEEEDEPLDFGEDFGAEGDEEKEEVDEEQEQWNNAEWGYMLHSHAYAVAQQEGSVPRRILPGAPLTDAAPIIRRRNKEELGNDEKALDDTDHESDSEHNHESDTNNQHDPEE